MNITTHSLKLYQVYARDEEPALPPIVSERVKALLTDPNEFAPSQIVSCLLYRHMIYTRNRFTEGASIKRAESHCILAPGTQFWQYIHEADLQFLASHYPAQEDLWVLTPATLVGVALTETHKAQGHPDVLLIEQFTFTE